MQGPQLSRRSLLGAAAGAVALGAAPAAAAAAGRSGVSPDPALPPTRDTYVLPLGRMDPQVTGSSGSLAIGSAATMPVLAGAGAAFALMRVAAGGLRAPHWHPDSWELQYFTAGRGRVEIVLPGGEGAQIDVGPGVAVFLPQGCGHAVRNLGDDELAAVLAFQVDTPRSITLGSFFSGLSAATDAQALRVDAAAVAGIPRPARDDPFPAVRPGAGGGPGPALPATAQPLSYDLAGAEPQTVVPGGTITHCDATVLPSLAGNDAALLLGRLQPGALREPHWHPDAWEINVCVEGDGQVDLVLADHTQATIPVTTGDAVFIPRGAGHAIHNRGAADLTFLSIFNADRPTDVGLAGFLAGLPAAVGAQALDVRPAALRPIPRPTAPPPIVARR